MTPTFLGAGTYGVVGPNAAGKTRLLRQINASAFAESAPHARFAGRTVADHLACAQLAHPNFRPDLARQVIGGIDPHARTRRLPAGHARLVILAGAMAAGASALLLDEPFDGLDIASRTRVREILVELLADRLDILVVTSHRSEDLTGLVDSVITVTGSVSGPAELERLRRHYPTASGRRRDVDKRVAGRDVLESSVLGGRVRASYVDPKGADAPAAELLYDTELLDLLAQHGIHPSLRTS